MLGGRSWRQRLQAVGRSRSNPRLWQPIACAEGLSAMLPGNVVACVPTLGDRRAQLTTLSLPTERLGTGRGDEPAFELRSQPGTAYQDFC
ncbi:hypothetical protein [Rubidibacter lacunae]|nr:hypothetical protein [Rubidibacter lacunae]